MTPPPSPGANLQPVVVQHQPGHPATNAFQHANAHYHQHIDVNGVLHEHKHELLDDGSIHMTHTSNGLQTTSSVGPGGTMNHGFIDTHGSHHTSTHHQGADGQLHSKYHETTSLGLHRTKHLVGANTEAETEPLFGTHKVTQHHADGTKTTTETHHWSGNTGDPDNMGAPDITVHHTQNPAQASGHNHSSVTHHHDHGRVETFNGADAERNANNAAWNARFQHDPALQPLT